MAAEGEQLSIWEKVDFDAPETNETDPEKKTPKEIAEERAESWKRWRLLLDVVGTIAWTYLILKVFFFDVDRELIDAAAPEQSWLIDLRFLMILGVIALAVIFLGSRRTLIGIAYVMFFPLIVIGWKVPRTIYRSKSWISLFAALHVVASVLTNFRYVLLATTFALFATAAILFTSSDLIVGLAMIVIAGILLFAMFRTLRLSARPASFISIQEAALDRFRQSDSLPQIAAVREDFRSAEIQRFTAQQQTEFLMTLQYAVLVQRLPLFWAYQLDQYRRSPAPVLFTGLAYAWLVIQTVVGLTLLNYGLYKIDATAYSFVDSPSLAVFARYAVSSLTGSEIGALQPESGMANALFLGATAFGVIFVIGFVVGLVLSFRQKSQDAALREMIDGFKAQSQVLESRLRAEYDVPSVEEAMKRLEELRAGLLGIITFFSSRIPSEFMDGPGGQPRNP
jgi:hypothetical protein